MGHLIAGKSLPVGKQIHRCRSLNMSITQNVLLFIFLRLRANKATWVFIVPPFPPLRSSSYVVPGTQSKFPEVLQARFLFGRRLRPLYVVVQGVFSTGLFSHSACLWSLHSQFEGSVTD